MPDGKPPDLGDLVVAYVALGATFAAGFCAYRAILRHSRDVRLYEWQQRQPDLTAEERIPKPSLLRYLYESFSMKD